MSVATPLASNWVEIGNLTGPQGLPGAPGGDGTPGLDGVSITGATVNGSGDLVLDLSNGSQVTAGHVRGEAAPILDPQASAQSVTDLPDNPPLLTVILVRDDGHWYVFEGDSAADDGKPGWTDIGQIRGADGATGADGQPGQDGSDGTDGVSVTGAAINGSGHLILTLSQGGPIDAGVARGSDGTDGQDGAEGEIGIGVIAYSGSVPAASSYRVGTLAFGADGSLLRATT